MARRLRNETTLTINWYDAVKWCDARSQHEGRTPCHHTGINLTVIHRTGQLFGRRHARGAAGVWPLKEGSTTRYSPIAGDTFQAKG
jgi:hypothetical protein